MAEARSTTVYGTVMETRLEGHLTVHRIEATGPDGKRIELEVVARKRHRGAVRVVWDPDGHADPHFQFAMPWRSLGISTGTISFVVLVGWIVLN